VSPRIVRHYPFDAYFLASLGDVCDNIEEIQSLKYEESSAQVLLVPKDSRGPRLISCEPLTFQWIQQGLRDALYRHVESHRLTIDAVRFTDQTPNQRAALIGSIAGKYSTLDLKEASDRVSVGLVRLLFPEPLLGCLLASRSLFTTLPSGEKIELRKFAPMGSAVCFPVLALTIWALLYAGMPDRYSRERIYVYGDDVIVPTEQSENAINILESFGLLVNRDKSCTKGFFRESCGVDAYQGVNVTPTRIRVVWSRHPSPDTYSGWIAYANSFWDKKYYGTYDCIVGLLCQKYGTLVEKSNHLGCPSLPYVPETHRPTRRRWNPDLQKPEYRVLDVVSRPVKKRISGWKMLRRYFAEATSDTPFAVRTMDRSPVNQAPVLNEREPLSVSSYTKRHRSILLWCWR
jgi:hypothetical protein